ncbi:MAG: FecR domain-containing protein [Sphingopyxis sp.]|nr:FecR domain-containing protein [Sphingopyxis sp.]
MPYEPQESLRARAIKWHIRLRDGDDETWEAFAEWLAQDPRHAAAYDEVEATDHSLDPLLPHVVVREGANDDRGDDGMGEKQVSGATASGRRWLTWGAGGAMAASIMLAVLLFPATGSDRYEVVTALGERQVIALDATTEVTLNGGTRMTFDRKNPRFASLASGEAYFKVRHDEANPFRLVVGDNIVEDAGTIFNVVHAAGEVRVAVAEGKVVYNPGPAAVALDAGEALVDRNGEARIQVEDVPTQAVGSWKSGSLVYSLAPLSQVAEDIGRTLGIRIEVTPAVGARPFSGTIILDGTGVAQLERLSPALDVVIRKIDDKWVMTAR